MNKNHFFSISFIHICKKKVTNELINDVKNLKVTELFDID